MVTRRAPWWVVGAVGLAAVLVGALAAITFTADGRRAIDIYGLLDSGFSPYLPEGRVATDDVCPEVDGCVQAVEAETMVVRRFGTQEQAARRAAEAAADGTDVHLSGWIVVEYEADELPEAERTAFEEGLDGINVSSPD